MGLMGNLGPELGGRGEEGAQSRGEVRRTWSLGQKDEARMWI